MLAIHKQIRREMGDRRISARKLAREIGKSEPYVRARINDELQLLISRPCPSLARSPAYPLPSCPV